MGTPWRRQHLQARRRFFIGSLDICAGVHRAAFSCAGPVSQFSQKVSRVTDRRRAFPYAFRPQCREEH